MRNKTDVEKVGISFNSDNARDVDVVIQEIKLHIAEMDKYSKELEAKIASDTKEYNDKVTASLTRLQKLINS